MSYETTGAVKKAKGDLKHTTPILIMGIVVLVMALISMFIAIYCGNEASKSSKNVYGVIYGSASTYGTLALFMWIVMVGAIIAGIGVLIYYFILRKRFESINIVCYSDYVKVCLYDYTTKSLENKEWKYSDIKAVNFINKICSVVVDKPYALPIEDAEEISNFLQNKIKG